MHLQSTDTHRLTPRNKKYGLCNNLYAWKADICEFFSFLILCWVHFTQGNLDWSVQVNAYCSTITQHR